MSTRKSHVCGPPPAPMQVSLSRFVMHCMHVMNVVPFPSLHSKAPLLLLYFRADKGCGVASPRFCYKLLACSPIPHATAFFIVGPICPRPSLQCLSGEGRCVSYFATAPPLGTKSFSSDDSPTRGSTLFCLPRPNLLVCSSGL